MQTNTVVRKASFERVSEWLVTAKKIGERIQGFEIDPYIPQGQDNFVIAAAKEAKKLMSICKTEEARDLIYQTNGRLRNNISSYLNRAIVRVFDPILIKKQYELFDDDIQDSIEKAIASYKQVLVEETGILQFERRIEMFNAVLAAIESGEREYNLRVDNRIKKLADKPAGSDERTKREKQQKKDVRVRNTVAADELLAALA